MKTKQPFFCGLIAVVPALILTACLSLTGGTRAHTHQWSEWIQVSGDDASEERVCKADSAHIQTRLTGTDRFTFEVIDETAYRVGAGTLTTGEMTIPAYYRPDTDSEYMPVTEIGSEYDYYLIGFSATDISSVYISEGVTSIRTYAFADCASLTSVTIPASVTSIAYRAFYNTAWLNSQPDGLVYASKVLYTYKGTMPSNTVINNIRADTIAIADFAFSGCENLTGITIPSSVRSIGERAFNYCTSLTSIMLSAGITSIGKLAFYGCESLASITLPASVKSIGELAFGSNASLTSITFPAGITFIGSAPFASCIGLTSITVAANNPNYASEGGILYNRAKTTLIQAPGAIKGSVNIPASVTSIGEAAFVRCINLIGISIPASVVSIGRSAFSGCDSLESVTIPQGVRFIGEDAFYYCKNLAGITIPTSITEIGSGAFSSWTPSQTINIEGHASQAAADTAWGSDWRSDCRATINYLGR